MHPILKCNQVGGKLPQLNSSILCFFNFKSSLKDQFSAFDVSRSSSGLYLLMMMLFARFISSFWFYKNSERNFTSFVGVNIIDSGITSQLSKFGNIWSTNSSKSHSFRIMVKHKYLILSNFLTKSTPPRDFGMLIKSSLFPHLKYKVFLFRDNNPSPMNIKNLA